MIESFAAQKVITRYRDDGIVVHNFTTSREWAQVSTRPDLDLSGDEAMGKASSLGLGLALAQKDRKVIVLDGDGSLLMNLGSLVTIANLAPPNLIHFLFENGIYRTTGGQPIPNAGRIDFAGFARDAGYAHVHVIDSIERLEADIAEILAEEGPTFVCLKILPATDRPPFPLPHYREQAPRLMTALRCASR